MGKAETESKNTFRALHRQSNQKLRLECCNHRMKTDDLAEYKRRGVFKHIGRTIRQGVEPQTVKTMDKPVT